MTYDYAVTLDNTVISTNSVTVQSPSLIKGLVKHPIDTITLLSNKSAPLRLSDIDIDQQGQVVIQNQAFRDAFEAASPAAQQSGGNNCNCNA